MALVSIIIPIYNTEKYLDKCIKSVVNQTLKDIEIILINDGSTDNSSNICDEWEKKDNRIKVVHQENKGLFKVREFGTKLSTSNYIGFIDSDDYIEDNMIEILYDKALAHNADMVQCGVRLFYEDDTTQDFGYEVEEILKENDTFNKIVKPYIEEDYYLQGIDSYVWNKLYKKELIIKVLSNIENNIKLREDALINLWAYSFCEKKIILKNCYLYHYRQLPNSMSRLFKEHLFGNQKSYFNEVNKIAEMFNLRASGLKIREDYAYCGLIQMIISSDINFYRKSKYLKRSYKEMNNKTILKDYSNIVDNPLKSLFRLVRMKMFIVVSIGTQIIIKIRKLGK